MFQSVYSRAVDTVGRKEEDSKRCRVINTLHSQLNINLFRSLWISFLQAIGKQLTKKVKLMTTGRLIIDQNKEATDVNRVSGPNHAVLDPWNLPEYERAD